MHFSRRPETNARKDALAVPRRPRNILAVVVVVFGGCVDVYVGVVVAAAVAVVEGSLHSREEAATRKALHHLRRRNSAQVHLLLFLFLYCW